MNSVLRRYVSALLCLLLVLTGHSMAMVRGASAATGQMVICVGATTTIIYTDANGEPTAAPHICPECLAKWHVSEPKKPLLTQATVSVTPWTFPLRSALTWELADTGFDARGPPATFRR